MLCLCDDVCVSVIISQVVLWVRSSVRAHRGYLHPSLASYPGGTGSPGGKEAEDDILGFFLYSLLIA